MGAAGPMTRFTGLFCPPPLLVRLQLVMPVLAESIEDLFVTTLANYAAHELEFGLLTFGLGRFLPQGGKDRTD